MNANLPNKVMQVTGTDCFRACVATVLACDIDRVPEACDGTKWDWDAFQNWLADQGLQAVEMTFENGGTLYPVSDPVRCIVTGPSPRPCLTGRHAVVANFVGQDGFILLHDPHPEQKWLAGDPTHAVFFVPIISEKKHESLLPSPQPKHLGVNDPCMIKIHVISCISSLQDEDGKTASREIALAITKLQEATMWIDEHLRLS